MPIIAAILIFGIWVVYRLALEVAKLTVRRRAFKAMARLIALAWSQTDAHALALVRRYEMNVQRDEYGGIDPSRIHGEIDRFLASAVLPKAQVNDYATARRGYDVMTALRERVLDRLYDVHLPVHDALKAEAPALIPDDAQAFEHWCADVLRQQGFEARVIGGPGDQGADILATKDGLRIAVQCKRWTKAVGNRAVQEVAAARTHHRANAAAVISTSGFTPSARQLAATNGVQLVNAAELPGMSASLN